MLRSVLVYILVALSPLSFAAMVWPSARGVLRRTIELLLSVILSKLVVCIAISVGVAALSGAGAAGVNDTGIGDHSAASMGTLFVGTAVLVIAAFAPFLLLKLIPWTEAALVAHGMSRSPVRAANTTALTANSASSIARLAGGSGAKSVAALPAGGSGSGWIVGAPLQGSAAGGATAGAMGGPAGIAAAGAVTAASSVTKGATQSVEASSDAIAGGTAKPEPTRNAGEPSTPPRQARPQPIRGMDAPPPDEDAR